MACKNAVNKFTFLFAFTIKNPDDFNFEFHHISQIINLFRKII